MASSAPQEILCLIAQQLALLDNKLSPYTLVNKSWQAAFERHIYASIVVRSPSDVTTVTVSDEEQYDKHGLPLETFIKITNGPLDWQRARRTYIRQILYRVAVPYWLSEAREKYDDYTYDHICRRENNQAFSEGIRLLFEHLSTWANQTISLQIALQAEDASTDEESGEPESTPTTGTGDQISSYCAEFLPRCSLPRASCVKSLEFPELETPAFMQWDDHSTPCSENDISLPACLEIASACSALENIRLDGGDIIPLTEPDMHSTMRIATAKGFSRLPQSVRYVALCWSSSLQDEIPEPRDPNESAEQDLLCATLHKVSMQLRYLRIEGLEVFPELFCPDGVSIEAHWPYLETLCLDRVSADALFGGVARYADGATPEDALTEQYINDLYTSLGHAAQKMPCLRSVVPNFASLGHELKLFLKDERWVLRIYLMKDYRPSFGVLEAWKVPGESLQPCKNRHWQEATAHVFVRGHAPVCLFYAEELLGWNSEIWKTYLSYSLLATALLTILLIYLRFTSRNSREKKDILLGGTNLPHLPPPNNPPLPRRRPHNSPPSPCWCKRTPRYGCCSQALVFSRSSALSIINLFEQRKLGFRDSLIEEIADQNGALTPSVVQHIGRKSSKGR
ncbi:hypothetical protein E4T39_04661 [Aureobasidium subglaciale]|nr:hypothetical protein E4T39_04661 [Aureobasidium subglaciale]